ncbi:MAG: hypothetical protein ABI431_04505 [Candidatus Tumulicola sp.]
MCTTVALLLSCSGIGDSGGDPGSCNRAIVFSAALRAAGIPSTTVRENGADHMGMLRALIDPNDPLNAALLYFISKLQG